MNKAAVAYVGIFLAALTGYVLMPILHGEETGIERPIATQAAKPGGLGFVMVPKSKQQLQDFCKKEETLPPPKAYETTYIVYDFFPDSPAATAGLQLKDVIMRINGVEVSAPEKLSLALARVVAGEPTEVVVRRIKTAGKGKKWETVKVTIVPVERSQVDAAMEERERSIPPVRVLATGIHLNVIGVPEISVEVKNTKSQAVEAFEIDVECFDKFDDPVSWPGEGNVFRGICQTTLPPQQTTRTSWQLSLHRNTTRAKLWVSRVKLGDGTVWTQSKAEADKADALSPARLIE